jgi:ParB/RepB/Spo0J family partition protein
VSSEKELEKMLCGRLQVTASQLLQVFLVEQRADDSFTVSFRDDWIDKPTWMTVNDLVREQRGEWDPKARLWTVPYKEEPRNEIRKPTKETKPSQVKCGYYQKFPVDSVVSPGVSLRLNIGDDIDELVEQIAASKADNELCVIAEPLICRPSKLIGCVEVGGGERRLLAAKKLGLGTVPVVVKEFSDEEFDRIRLMENLARKDMTDYETARAIKYLMDKYPKEYSTQENVAAIFGKTQGWVAQRLRMLELTEDKIITRVINPSQFTERQARAILEAPEERRPEVANQIAEHIKKEGTPPSAREIKGFVHPTAADVEVDSSSHPTQQFHEEPEEELTIEDMEEPLDSSSEQEPFETQSITPTVQVEKIDTGVIFTCPECGWQATHIHIKPSGKHKLEEVREL